MRRYLRCPGAICCPARRALQACCAPEFDDPNAEFVICTDASDYAVGGVLMQWQHQEFPGPPPPLHDGMDGPKTTSKAT